MNKLISIQVTSEDHVEKMRHLYNENLNMLATMPLPYRKYDEQQSWWNENKQNIKAFLYAPVENPNNVIAFSALTNRGAFVTPIFAIQKKDWGNGFGKEIIMDYLRQANGPLAGSQLKSNTAICHLNSKVGWEILDTVLVDGKEVDLLYHPGINPSLKNQNDVREIVRTYLLKKYTN